ncbi:MAG: 3'(2'),5'-bisphosphate nucleotidase CysQ [Rhodobacteraceae bacterium]|nr:3'(2'),5'-bisphosphate nucleotidase CysQ [Paracoccaceae bacterium]
MSLIDDLALLIDAAQQAGDIACRYFGSDAQKWMKPDGTGLVTEADLAVDAFLSEYFCRARPDYGWLSEETEDTGDRLTRDRVFVVDPIDGTRSFAKGSNTWAHSLALIEHGRSVAGVIYLPNRGLLYAAAANQGATLNGSGLTVSDQSDLDRAQMLVTRPNLDPEHWTRVPLFQCSYRPSLAYRMALVAEGRFDGILTFRPSWEWDIAAGDIILREAGGCCTDQIGHALRFNNAHPATNGIIAGNPDLHRAVMAVKRPRT